MIQIWVDPSYTGTGICIINTCTKHVRFGLLSMAQTKRVLINYFVSAKVIQQMMKELIRGYDINNVVIYQEAPFPQGISSGGLYGLQFLLLALYKKLGLTVYSIPPSFVSNAVKKFLGVKKETSKMRKDACQKNKLLLEKHGYRFENPLMLKKKGDDVATAMLFWTETYRQGRKWPCIMLKGEENIQELDNGIKTKKDKISV